MKNETKNRSRVFLPELIFIGLIFLAFSAKLWFFYTQFRLGGYELCFTLASVAILLTVYALVNLISHRAAKWTVSVLYIFFSIVMAVDGVYYTYASKLPSVVQLGMAWQLDDVSSTIDNLIRVRHIASVIDLPFFIAAAVLLAVIPKARRKKAQKNGSPIKSSGKGVSRFIISAVSGFLIALSAVYLFAVKDFRTKYLTNELFSYHVMDIYDSFFAKKGERAVDKAQYTSPDMSGSDYYGIAKDRNVIIIQVEAMQNFVLGATYEGQEIMPNLNALLENDTLYFNNYYYQIGGGNTADAEFTVNNSLFAPESEAAYVKYPTNDYFGLPKLLKSNGYTGAHAFHGYIGEFWNRESAYPGQGFDDFTSLEDFEQTEMFPMGLSDHEFFRQSLEIMETYEEPFYSFMITVSSHYPYALPLEARDIELKDTDVATLFGLYIQSMNYVDRMIGEFIEGLKEDGLYDNSIILIYGDHYALTNTDPEISRRVSAMLGRSYTIYDVFNVPLIIHIPGYGKSETVEVTGGHIDVLPTLLCLLGIHNDKAVMFGQNLLEADAGFVCEQTHMARGSFISDSLFFKRPYNNIKTNYDAYEYGTMERLDPDLFEAESDYAWNRIADCAALLENNDVLTDK